MKKLLLILSLAARLSAEVVPFAQLNMSFENMVQQTPRLVIKWYMNGCGPCKSLKPIVEQLSTQYQDILFVELDIRQYNALAQKFGIRSVPTLLYFKDGKLVGKHTGYAGSAVLSQEIASYLP